MRDKVRARLQRKPQTPANQAKTSGEMAAIDREYDRAIQTVIDRLSPADLVEFTELIRRKLTKLEKIIAYSPAGKPLPTFEDNPEIAKETADLSPEEVRALAEWHRQQADKLDEYNSPEPATSMGGKIKGFVLVNLAAWRQKQLRALAAKAGISLRCAMDWAVRACHERLQYNARIYDITGLTERQWKEKFGGKVSLN